MGRRWRLAVRGEWLSFGDGKVKSTHGMHPHFPRSSPEVDQSPKSQIDAGDGSPLSPRAHDGRRRWCGICLGMVRDTKTPDYIAPGGQSLSGKGGDARPAIPGISEEHGSSLRKTPAGWAHAS